MNLVFGSRDEGAEGAVTREPRTQRMLSAATPGFDTRTDACKHCKHALARTGAFRGVTTEPADSARRHDSSIRSQTDKQG